MCGVALTVVGWRPGCPVSFRAGPARQGRSCVASLRDGLRPPLTDRPVPEQHKTPGIPPKDGRGERGEGRPCRLARLWR
ncbi:hypothetical protein DRB89_41880 [Streptomyces sp. ICC4]|nr:hypothetical protein DRB89_41880 [Streptomyces sp. ICC4]